MTEKGVLPVFENDKYAEQSARLYCWLLCAKRLGISRDIRIYIAKMCVEPVLYIPGDVVVSKDGHVYELVNGTFGLFNPFGIRQIWKIGKMGLFGFIPCPKCHVPTYMLDFRQLPTGKVDYSNCNYECFRHGPLSSHSND